MEAVIVSHSDMLSRVMTRLEDERTIVICRSVAKWLAEMARRPKPQRFLCLDRLSERAGMTVVRLLLWLAVSGLCPAVAVRGLLGLPEEENADTAGHRLAACVRGLSCCGF
jgi:hypothetical protein